MAGKKKAYQRFEELTRQATARMPAEADLPIRLSPEMRQALEQRAVADNTTPSEILHEALRRYLELPA